MKQATILGLSAFLAMTMPLQAETVQPTPVAIESKIVRIPPQSAIFVTLSATEEIDTGGKQQRPVTLTVTQPVLDVTGNIGIPIGSKIDARLSPIRKDKMAVINAERLVIGSRIIPIQAKSDRMPSERIVMGAENERGCQVGGRVTPDFAYILGERNGRNALGGNVAINCTIPIFSRDRVFDRATFTAGKEYLLVLEEEVTFPQELLAAHSALLERQ